MNSWIEALLIFQVLTNLLLLGSSRLSACIRVVAVQGFALGLLPPLTHGHLTLRVLGLAVISMAIKAFVFPSLLNRALRDANVRREIEPFVGYTVSTLFGGVALAISFWLSWRLPLPHGEISSLIVPVAFFSMLTGLFLIVSRRKALTQVLGYLVFENGIFVFGVGLTQEVPLIVEFGVLLDVFVAVFVMGIALFHISREFDHIDADRLSSLKD